LRQCARLRALSAFDCYLAFGNFWLTIQNTTNRHVRNAFDLIYKFPPQGGEKKGYRTSPNLLQTNEQYARLFDLFRGGVQFARGI
jgi:hypothetical protein